MAYFQTRLLILVLIFICFSVQSSEARKLLKSENKEVGSSLEESLALSALPKGSVPPSTPSNKGHATVLVNEKHFTAVPAQVERNSQSVPSPGIGH